MSLIVTTVPDKPKAGDVLLKLTLDRSGRKAGD